MALLQKLFSPTDCKCIPNNAHEHCTVWFSGERASSHCVRVQVQSEIASDVHQVDLTSDQLPPALKGLFERDMPRLYQCIGSDVFFRRQTGGAGLLCTIKLRIFSGKPKTTECLIPSSVYSKGNKGRLQAKVEQMASAEMSGLRDKVNTQLTQFDSRVRVIEEKVVKSIGKQPKYITQMTRHLQELKAMHQQITSPDLTSGMQSSEMVWQSEMPQLILQISKKTLNLPRKILPLRVDQSHLQNGDLTNVEDHVLWLRNSNKLCLPLCDPPSFVQVINSAQKGALELNTDRFEVSWALHFNHHHTNQLLYQLSMGLVHKDHIYELKQVTGINQYLSSPAQKRTIEVTINGESAEYHHHSTALLLEAQPIAPIQTIQFVLQFMTEGRRLASIDIEVNSCHKVTLSSQQELQAIHNSIEEYVPFVFFFRKFHHFTLSPP